jgi:aspartate carbamoyltransferase catalytic subunit
VAPRWLSIDDVDDAQLAKLLVRSAELADGAAATRSRRHCALLFLEPSLRTRTGVAAAAQRLGWPTPVDVLERRSSQISMQECVEDTVAVVSAYFDVLVVRSDRPASTIARWVGDGVSVVNAGDRGNYGEHPTQALIDVFAMTRLVADVRSLSVVVCGDLRMRSARSLLKLFARCRPRELTLVTDQALTEGLRLPPELGTYRMLDSLHGLPEADAIHAVGIPHGAASEAVRTRLRIDAQALDRLSPRGRVFSPMPVIDEVAQTVRHDPRVAYLRQSALALPVRMAVLEAL